MAQQDLLARLEKLVAPADDAADRALLQRQVERTADQELEPEFKLPEDGGHR